MWSLESNVEETSHKLKLRDVLKIPGLKPSKTLMFWNTEYDSGTILHKKKPKRNNFIEYIILDFFFFAIGDIIGIIGKSCTADDRAPVTGATCHWWPADVC